MEIKHPSTRDLMLSAALVCSFAIVAVVLVYVGLTPPQNARLVLSGATAGVICSSFGLSIPKYGARALLALAAVSTLLFLAMLYAGVA